MFSLRFGLPLSLALVSCQQAPAAAPSCPCAAASSGAESKPSAPTDPEGPRPGESPDQEQKMFAAVFAAQEVDAAWASDQEARFRAAFEQAQIRAALVSVECRRTLCKLMVLPLGRDAHKVKGAIGDAMATEEGGSFSVMGGSGNRDGSAGTTWVSRNHYSLPDKDGKIAERPKVKPVP